jgi:hypothetical protein
MVKAKQRRVQFLRARVRQKTNPVIAGMVLTREEVTTPHTTCSGFPDYRCNVVYIVITA